MDAQLQQLAARNGLARLDRKLFELMRPGIRLFPNPTTDSQIPLGASKFGGAPDLSADQKWPVTSYAGRLEPLVFVAQLNLKDFVDVDTEHLLPAEGLLSFFYAAAELPTGDAPEMREAWRVLLGTSGDLQRAVAPEGASPYTSCALKWSLQFMLPPTDSEAVDALKLDADESDLYDALRDDLAASQGHDNEPQHWLLGYPYQLQDNIQFQCQTAPQGLYGELSSDDRGWKRAMHDSLRWHLLLQVDSDRRAKMRWGSGGMLYFMIHDEALSKRQFSDCWLVFQDL
ncbi:MAG: YwqG family protein [Anaerolineae bacterium]